MKNRKALRGFVAFIALLLGITSVGFSSWMLEKAELEKGVVVTKTPEIAVCYNNKTNKKYTTIEKALSEASSGDNIYVIPGLKDENNSLYEVKITSPCTIKSGVSLELPYEDDGSSTHKIAVENDFSDAEGFADVNSSNVATYRKTLVSIAEGTVLTIESGAKLEIGAIIGTKTAIPSAHVKSSYCEILLKANAKIENQGTLNIYGYIKEDSTNNGSSVRHYSGSTVYMPLVFYDFRGGSFSTAANGENVMPFNSFDFPNCQILQQYDYGSKMSAFAGIYLAEQKQLGVTVVKEGVNIATAKVISSGNEKCLFKLSSGYFTMKYTPANCKYTTNDALAATTEKTANLTTIHICGDLSVSSFAINIAGVVNIDTAKMLCPISYKFRIFVDQGNLSIDTMIKFLGGSSLNIGPSGSVNFNKEVVFYQNYIPPIETVPGLYPSVYETAELINNGLLTVNDGFGGFVGTTEDTGLSMISNGITTSVSSTEVIAASRNGATGKVDKSESHTETARALISSGDGNEPTEQNLIADKIYKSAGTYWRIAGKDILSVTLSIPSGESNQGESKTYSIKANLNPDPYDSTEVNYEWSCDSSGAIISGNGTSQINFTTPANGTYEDKTYVLNCVVSFKKVDGTYDSVSVNGTYVAKRSIDIGSVSLSPSSGESESGAAKSFSISAVFSPVQHNSNIISYDWSCDDGATINGSGQNITFNIPANETGVNITYNLSCVVNFKKADGSSASLTATGKFVAKGAGDISGISLTSNPENGSTDAGKSKSFTVTATTIPEIYGSTGLSYSWEFDKKGVNYGISYPRSNQIMFTIPAATDKTDVEYTLTCTASFTKINGQPGTVPAEMTFTAKGKSGGGGGDDRCLLPTAQVLMADGTYKNAGDIRTGDMVMSFNHETGRVESNVVIGNDDITKEATNYQSVNLKFSNGKSTDFIYEHGYFDITLNKYVYMHEDDFTQFIGHEFVFVDDGEITSAKLVSGSVSTIYTTLAAPATANHLNLIVDDMLSMEGGLTGLFNIFEYDPDTLAFDQAKKQADIDKYGLLGYDAFEQYFPEEIYNILPCKYLAVSIGKGYITWDEFGAMVDKWKDQLLENL